MSVTVYTGCMFSGKTEKLIERAEQYKNRTRNDHLENLFRGSTVLIVKHQADNRYTEGENEENIVSHSRKSIDCVCVNKLKPIYDELEANYYLTIPRYIIVDETQFFETQDVIDFTLGMKKLGCHMFMGGLNLRYDKLPFPSMTGLIKIADWVHFLKGTCNDCENPSTHTYLKKEVNKENVDDDCILVGGSEFYLPVCEKCFDERREEEFEEELKKLLVGGSDYDGILVGGSDYLPPVCKWFDERREEELKKHEK